MTATSPSESASRGSVTCDALFLSYYEDVDRWHNDYAPSASGPTGSPAKLMDPSAPGGRTILPRTARQAVSLDGGVHDLARFFSYAAHGDTREYRRYDSFSIGHLSGKYYESLGKRHGFHIRHENHVNRVDLERLGQTVKPRWVMLSSTFMTETAHVMDAMQHLRRAFPDVPIVVGGLFLVEVEKSVSPRDFQRLLLSFRADVYAVTPLGEAAFLSLLQADGENLGALTLPGSWVKVGARFVKSDAPEPGLPIDDHYVRWDQLDQSNLYHTTHTRTARSCAFACSFCSYPANQGPLTLSNPETLRLELQHLERSGRIKSLVFTDDTFNVPMPRFKELCRVLKDFDVNWYSYFRSQFADDETVDLMVEAGCKGVFLGYESIDDKVLKNMRKAVNRKAYERGTAYLRDAGLMMHANFIVGFPGDRSESVQEVLDFVDEYKVDSYYVSAWFCSPATPIAQEKERFGIEGQYLRWSHDTMDSDEAMELEEWAIDRAEHSVWSSDLGGRSFWSMLHLVENGLSKEEARRALKTFAVRAGRNHSKCDVDAAQDFQWLRARLAQAKFPVPPGIENFRPPADAAPFLNVPQASTEPAAR